MTLLPGPRFSIAGGIPVFVEPSHELPLVDVEVLFREGAVLDPHDRDGLTRLTTQMIRRGPRGMSAEAFDEAIEALGATLGASVGSHSLRFTGAVIRRNLEPYLALVGRMLSDPGMRAKDLARQKRKNEAELVEMRDHDRALAARAFRRFLFGAHPYGRPATGTLDTVSRFTQAEVRTHYEHLVTTGNVMVGIAGDVEPDELAPLLERTIGSIPKGPRRSVPLAAPAMQPGRRVLVVDKRERAQTQVYVGALGAKVAEPDYHALLVANTGFGGMFTSRLMQEVRVERGWSYGAHSKLGTDREREAWSAWTHPAATQVLDCLKLELELIEAWMDTGLDDDEIARAKDHLVKSHAFELETAEKRLDPQLESELYSLPLDWYPRYVELVRAVETRAAAEAVRSHMSARDLAITLVATATDELLSGLRSLPGVRSVERIGVADV